MRIAVMNASSQRAKNALLDAQVRAAVRPHGHTVENLGVFPEETAEYSYLQIAVSAAILLEGGAADFVVTGCSSGNGMALALNSLPGVLCGYLSDPTEAYLFGRINGGNAASIPLGYGFGWAGEINLLYILEKLFAEPFGTGYPPGDAPRKRRDAAALKALKRTAQRSLADVLPALDRDLVAPAVRRPAFRAYFASNCRDQCLAALVREL